MRAFFTAEKTFKFHLLECQTLHEISAFATSSNSELSLTFSSGIPIDDSRGERGAASVECFIAQGKAND